MALPTEAGLCNSTFIAPTPAPSPFSPIATTPPKDHNMRSKKNLLNLPAEVRLMIYELMFPADSVTVHNIDGSLHSLPDAHKVAADYLGILTTCRKIHTEANPVLYSNTKFEVYIGCFETIISAWYSPDSKGVCRINPWLDNPRSIVSLRNARKLSLTMEASVSPEVRKRVWTEQIKNDLRGASDLKLLDITLKATSNGQFDQDETDHTLWFLEQSMSCDGPIKARMDLELGSMRFDPTNYYRMVAALRGLDYTVVVFANKMVGLKQQKLECTSEAEAQAKLLTSLVVYVQAAMAEEQGHADSLTDPVFIGVAAHLVEAQTAIARLAGTLTQVTQEIALTWRQTKFLCKGSDGTLANFKSICEASGLQSS